MEEIDLREIFQMFWKKKVQILMIVLVFVIIGCVYTLEFITPKYSSSITMVLTSNNQENETNSTITTTDITLNSKLLATYSKLIKSKTVLKEVISNLNIEMEEERLEEDITVKAVSNTELIKVTVENENAQLASDIANEIARVFQVKVREMYNIDNIQLINEAEASIEPSNINRKRDIMLFTVFGIAISTLYVFVANMLDNTVKGPQTIEEEFDLPVLASIPILQSKHEEGGKK